MNNINITVTFLYRYSAKVFHVINAIFHIQTRRKSQAMGPGDKFCLQWNDFEKNISQAFKQLREDQDFFDVTIACEDEEVEAHKLVLSACSPFFQALFKRYKHDHPLLYLKNVKYSDFSNLLDFIYYGMKVFNY